MQFLNTSGPTARWRSALAGLLVVAALGGFNARAQSPAWGAPVAPRPESEALARSVPIADVHLHYAPARQTPGFIARIMAANNVQWAGAVGDYDAALHRALGDRYIAAIGQAEFTEALQAGGEAALQDLKHPAIVRLFENAEALLASGQVRGFGEIHISNVGAVGSAASFFRKIPLDSPVVYRMYELAHAHRGFVQIHYDRDNETVSQILAMAKRFPNALTIVSHCLPRGTPADMRRLFEGADNILCEISGATAVHGIDRIVSRDGMRSAWLQLVEDFPDRVMLGSDPCCGLMPRYAEIMELMRTRALAAMKPETLEKVAFRNAVRVFGLPPPKP